MEQKIFSEFIKKFIELEFYGFMHDIKYHDDESFDCTLRSPSDKFSIWLATCNSEITIGLKTPDGNTGIHTHISCYEIEDLDICLKQLSKIINDVIDDKLILYREANGHYNWGNYAEFLGKIGAERFFWK